MKDLALSAVIGVFQVVGSRSAQPNQLEAPDLGRLPLDWRGYALLLVGPLAIAVRRRFPASGLLATMAATSTYLVLGGSYGPVFISPVIMIFSAILYGQRLAAWLISAGFFLFVVVYATWLIPEPLGLFHHSAVAAYLLLTLTIAEFTRSRRERLAERKRVAEEETRRQASEERLSMARELHDVLAHNISLIHVQASTALHLLDDHPEQARTALATIKQASKDVLTEMRGVIGLLRDGAPRSPTAGMSRLRELIERSGLDVTLKVVGDARPLPTGIDRAGYRIVQESLTNVTRHVPGSAVDIQVTYGSRELTVIIDDDGTGRDSDATAKDPDATATGGGNGIPGMRERAAALGGSLSAGPRPDGGFRVIAVLPLSDLTPSPASGAPTSPVPPAGIPASDTPASGTPASDTPAGAADQVESVKEHN